eukprot:1149380-Pelagomonas_calceolata.AAC.2
MPIILLPLDVLLRKIILLTARFWHQGEFLCLLSFSFLLEIAPPDLTARKGGTGSKEPQVPSTTEQETGGLEGIYRVARSTWLRNLAVKRIRVFNSALVTKPWLHVCGRLDRMCMEFACKLASFLVVEAYIFDMFLITSLTNTQKGVNVTASPQIYYWKGLHAAVVPPPTVAQALCLRSILFQSSVCATGTQLIPCEVLCLLRNTWCEREEEREREVGLAW